MTTLRLMAGKPKRRSAAKKPSAASAKAAKKPAARIATELANSDTQAKHRRAAEMLRELRSGAEALSANADRLLSRFTS